MKAKTTLILWPLLVAAGCSSLSVSEMTKDKHARADGVPYYPLRQDFVLSELALDESGAPTENVTWKVDLVAGPDYGRGYLIRNSPTWFSKTDFSVTRDAQGCTLAVNADVDDQTLETVTALASFVSGAAKTAATLAGADVRGEPKAGAGDRASGEPKAGTVVDELQPEYDVALTNGAALKAVVEKLNMKLKNDPKNPQLLGELAIASKQLALNAKILTRIPLLQELRVMRVTRQHAFLALEKLACANPADGKAIKLAKDNLVELGARIAELEKKLAEKEAPKGVTPSQYIKPEPSVVQDLKAAEAAAHGLAPGQFGVYLVPRK